MFIIIGYLVLMFSIYGGYVLCGGHLALLFQPLLLLMVGGGGFGFFIIANNAHTIKQTLIALPELFKADRPAGNTLHVLEKILEHRGSGDQEAAAKAVRKALKEKQFARAVHPSALGHMVGAMRLAGLAGMTADEFARMLETDLQSRIAEAAQVSRAVCNLGHVMVAMGVVTSLLGIVHAGSLGNDPDVLLLITRSLIGAFLGILIGWGMVLAVGHAIRAKCALLHAQYHCINLAMAAHLRGLPVDVALAAGRMALPHAYRVSGDADDESDD